MVSHILVVDDQISLPRFIAMELYAAGYQVSVSDHVTVATVQELKPDLIVLNWELRSTPGIAACYQLRLIDSQVPIVVITAEEGDSCCPALELGVQTYLTKPFSMNELLKAITAHLKLQTSSV